MDKLNEFMGLWRDGLLSNGEVLGWLLNAQAEVIEAIRISETLEADVCHAHLALREGWIGPMTNNYWLAH